MARRKDNAERIYQYIQKVQAEKQKAPSQREIAKACELAVSTVSYHLDALEATGRLQRAWYKSRSLRLVHQIKAQEELTESLYQYIRDYHAQIGTYPSQREMAEACHLSKTSVYLQLKQLEEMGRIRVGEGHRDLELLKDLREN